MKKECYHGKSQSNLPALTISFSIFLAVHESQICKLKRNRDPCKNGKRKTISHCHEAHKLICEILEKHQEQTIMFFFDHDHFSKQMLPINLFLLLLLPPPPPFSSSYLSPSPPPSSSCSPYPSSTFWHGSSFSFPPPACGSSSDFKKC
jgi:hypothetical protein